VAEETRILVNPVFSPFTSVPLGPPKAKLGGPAADSSVGSLLSLGGAGSIASIGSAGCIGSIGSAGSILSIGSVGSILSIGSAGSVLSIGSLGSVASIGSGFSVGALGGWCQGRPRVVEHGATLLALAALVTAALHR
jgi:hypothetical protein